MNELTNITGNGPVTMSSREIADLLEARHADVCRTIERLMEREAIGRYAPLAYTHPQNGQQYNEYLVGKRDSYVIVAQLSPEFTARLVDRWQELESGAAVAALNDPAKLRLLLLENVEKVLSLEAAVNELSPKAKSYEFLTRMDGTMCITDAAKALNLRPKDLFQWLQSEKWIYRRAGNGHFVGFQSKIGHGLIDHRVEEVTRSDGSTKITEQVRITAKGMAKLGEVFGQELAA